VHHQAHPTSGLDVGAQIEPAQMFMVGFQKAVDPTIPRRPDTVGFDAERVAMVDQPKQGSGIP
jgi:hypothetical protein